MKSKKTIQSMGKAHLDKIYKAIKDVAREFNVKNVNYFIVNNVIKASRLKSGNKEIQEYEAVYNKMLDSLDEIFKKASKVSGDGIPLSFIKKTIKATKSGF